MKTTIELSCRNWAAEAALRMLQNNLHPDVAEHPEDLIVYGGTGKAARDWPSYHAIERTLKTLNDDETLLVQSGKPVGVMQTHEWAPRVLLANSNLVGDWANWDEFRRLEQLGLTMYGQMTAGSWIYIGTQGILQGTYETFAAVANKRFGGSLANTITLTGGLGGMGGAQPLAVTMNGGVAICVEVDQSRIQRRLETRYLDVEANSIDHALELATNANGPLSIGLLGNCADVLPELLKRDAPIDIVTDQTSAHDPLAYLPSGIAFEDWARGAAPSPTSSTEHASRWPATWRRWSASRTRAPRSSTTATRSAPRPSSAATTARSTSPGFVPAYIRPLFCEGKGPFRWAALSGDPQDIAHTDQAVLDLFPENESLHRWITLAQEKVQFQGLPARICWLGAGERDKAGLAFNELVANGTVQAPIVIGRDHLDCGSVASPYRETESMLDGSRRDRRLAAAERDGQRRQRRLLGQHPPRRRRRHRPQHPRRPGERRRRHPARRPEARARPHQRPRDGRDPPRRRRLRARGGGRGGEGRARPDDGMTTYFADYAWLGGDGVERDVAIEVADGRIAAVRPGAERTGTHLKGVTIPGLANAHSHAFQRALRGRTQRGGGSFWTWREDMYALAATLTPDRTYELAKGTYAEMRKAGITTVGEFDYVHHSEALIAAANETGMRLTLLDACYLAGGFDTPPNEAQQRFSDGDAEKWAERVSQIKGAKVGAAIHSVRAVPMDQLPTVVEFAKGRPLHFHVSEQRAENEQCLAKHGLTPVQLLAEQGALGPNSTAVHATHLHENDDLGDTTICMCPTTERDLADGIGNAGPRLALGSDSHAIIDLFEEARAVELNLRLKTEQRGHFTARALLEAATNHSASGGRMSAGSRPATRPT